MYTAYFVSTTYKQVVKKKEIAKAKDLEGCREVMIKSNYWQYIKYLLDVRQVSNFEEYVFITQSNGDTVFTTKNDFNINQLIPEGLLSCSK